MELQIQDLISAIKKDGVDAAQEEAGRILAEAKEQAGDIVARAKEEAARIRAKIENEVNVLKESAKITAEHAKRDAVLAFKQSVQAEFEKLLDAEVTKAVNGAVLARLIEAALSGEDASQYAAEVREVTDGLKGELAKKIRAGLEIRVNPEVRGGFRLALKDGTGYFDCTDEEIVQMLLPYFSDFAI